MAGIRRIGRIGRVGKPSIEKVFEPDRIDFLPDGRPIAKAQRVDLAPDDLQAEISTLRVPVSSLCIAASVPANTALRWLKTMVQQGMFLRRADLHDGRRVFVELAPHTSQSMRRYFAEIGRLAPV